MKTLKKLSILASAVFALAMIVSCSPEPSSTSDNPGNPTIIARYVQQEVEEGEEELSLEFYADNTWMMFELRGDFTNSNSYHTYVLAPVYKGTYSGNPNANGQIHMTITNEEAAEPPSAEEQARVYALMEEGQNSDHDITIKVNVPWQAYSGEYPNGTLTINNGTTQFADSTFCLENNNSGNSGNGSGNSGSGSSNPTIISKYTGDEDFENHTLEFIEFYSDNTWVFYHRDDCGDTTRSCNIYTIAPVLKGTYSGNPNADGQVSITITEETLVPSQEEQARLESQKQANMNSDRDVTIMVNLQWEAYSGSDATTTLTINNRTTEFFGETYRR